jgi:hypothetical protein
MAIGALDRSQGAEGAAPAAASGKHQTADKGQNQDSDDAGGDQSAGMVEEGRTGGDAGEEDGYGNEEGRILPFGG